jgi:hypothetical protein
VRRFVLAVVAASVAVMIVLALAAYVCLLAAGTPMQLSELPAAAMPAAVIGWPLAAIACAIVGGLARIGWRSRQDRAHWRVALLFGALMGGAMFVLVWRSFFPDVAPIAMLAIVGALAGASGGAVFWKLAI